MLRRFCATVVCITHVRDCGEGLSTDSRLDNNLSEMFMSHHWTVA